ncbi:hypothetical protein GCM10022221_20630 [Actinocorallia aurea]
MQFEERMYAKLKFFEKLAELHENAFEDFFHNLMSAKHPSYIDVRTHGNIGDQGADGLLLHDRKLYACYAPPTFNVGSIEEKFFSDLKKAKEKRVGQYDIFVFVHNDMRGMHPEMSSILANASRDNAPLKIEHLGRRRLWQVLMGLEKDQVEDLLGCEIPIHERVYGIGLEDLKPLLEHLKSQTSAPDPFQPLPEIHENKLDYNNLEGDSRYALVNALKNTYLIGDYYRRGVSAYERDEVAAGFSIYYQQLKEKWDTHEDILWQLVIYVLGNQLPDPRTHRAAWVILAYFFERCDIFEQPPDGWTPYAAIGGSG